MSPFFAASAVDPLSWRKRLNCLCFQLVFIYKFVAGVVSRKPSPFVHRCLLTNMLLFTQVY